MNRKSVISILFVLILSSNLFFAQALSADALRPYVIGDSLKLEKVGKGLSCADQVFWEQAPPYEQIRDFSFGFDGAWRNGGFKIQSLKIEAKKKPPAPIFNQDAATTYFLIDCSPQERYVIYYAVKNNSVFMGAYDLLLRKNRSIPIAPVVASFSNTPQIIWISPYEFITAAYKDGERPVFGVARAHVSETVFEAGRGAWSGGLSADILDNRQAESVSKDELLWKPGAIVKVNIRSGKTISFANGMYESLKISPDGRYLAALRQADLPPSDPSESDTDWVLSQSKLVIFDLKERAAPHHIVPDKNVFIESLAWASDRNKLAFFAWDEGAGVRSGIYHAYDPEAYSLTSYPHNGLDLASERERGISQKPERVIWVDDRLAVFARSYGGTGPRFTYRDRYKPGRSIDPGKADWFLLDNNGESENLTTRFKRIAAIPLHADAGTLTVLADGDVWRLAFGAEPVNLTVGVEADLALTPELRYSRLHKPFEDFVTLALQRGDSSGFAIVNFKTGVVSEVTSPGSGGGL